MVTRPIRVVDSPADAHRRALRLRGGLDNGLNVPFGDHDAEPDSHVEYFEHLRVRHDFAARIANQLEDSEESPASVSIT